MPWILSYVGSTFALIVVVILLVAGLGAIAFFAKNWKAAVAAGLVLAAGFAYQQVDRAAYQRRVAEEATAKVEQLETRINVLNAANESDAMRAIADGDKITELEGKAHDTPEDFHIALPRAAARRVSDVRWTRPGEDGAAADPAGHPDLLPRWPRKRPRS